MMIPELRAYIYQYKDGLFYNYRPSYIAAGKALFSAYKAVQGRSFLFDACDYVGFVAAMIADDQYPPQKYDELAIAFGEIFAQQVISTFHAHLGVGPVALWDQRGPAYDDIGFVHPALIEAYPICAHYEFVERQLAAVAEIRGCKGDQPPARGCKTPQVRSRARGRGKSADA